LGGVLDRHHADIGLPGLDGTEDLVEGIAAQWLDRMAEVLQRRLLRERTLRPEIRHLERTLQPSTGGDDFGPDSGNRIAGKGAGIGLAQAAYQAGLAFGVEHRTAGIHLVLDL